MKSVHEAVKRWGDDWSISRGCSTLGDSSYAQDYRDAEMMAHLTESRAKPARLIERRFAVERREFIRGLTERRKN
jgi:hypothetical protein